MVATPEPELITAKFPSVNQQLNQSMRGRRSYTASGVALTLRLRRQPLRRADVCARCLTPPDLLHHAQHVPVLPAFDNHAVRSAKDGDAGYIDRHAGRRNAQSV